MRTNRVPGKMLKGSVEVLMLWVVFSGGPGILYGAQFAGVAGVITTLR